MPRGGWDFSKIPLYAPPLGQPREKPGEQPGVRPPSQNPAPQSPPSQPATIASQTVANEPGASTRTTIGVGEQVNLSYSAGKTHWATSAGTLSSDYDDGVFFNAPDTPQNVTVSAGTAKIILTVIAPASIVAERFPDTGVSHTKDRPDSGIMTTTFLGPDTVNFRNVKYREVNVGAICSGVFKPFEGRPHDPSPKTIGMQDTVIAGKGTQSRAQDKACSGDPGTPPPFETGSILYDIPNEYQVADGPFHHFANATQLSTYSNAQSVAYTYKAGARGWTTLSSPTSNPDMCLQPAPP